MITGWFVGDIVELVGFGCRRLVRAVAAEWSVLKSEPVCVKYGQQVLIFQDQCLEAATGG
jgi:hypothetical protein